MPNESRPPQAKNRSPFRAKWWIVLILLLVGAIIFALSRMEVGSVKDTWESPDGTVVQVLSVFRGGPAPKPSPWEPALKKILAPKWFFYLFPQKFDSTAATNEISFYFTLSDSNGVALAKRPFDRFFAEDEGGFSYSYGGSKLADFKGIPREICKIYLNGFPRRQREFKVHLANYGKTNDITFMVRNPFPRSFPNWDPGALPQTRTNGPARLTLKSIGKTGIKELPALKCDWAVESSDTSWTNSEVFQPVSVADATGNQSKILSPSESAWSLKADLYRVGRNDFSPEERCLITPATVPKPGEYTVLRQTGKVAGFDLKFAALCNDGQLVLRNDDVESFNVESFKKAPYPINNVEFIAGRGNPRFMVRQGKSTYIAVLLSGPFQGGEEIQCSLIGEDGGEIESSRALRMDRFVGELSSSKMDGAKTMLLSALEIQSTNLPPVVSIELRVSRPLSFEFMVNPRDVK